jgi:hypothetical protein
VQLVKYDDFKELGMRELALQVLGEVPDQFVDYMIMKQVALEQLYNPTKDKEQQANMELLITPEGQDIF